MTEIDHDDAAAPGLAAIAWRVACPRCGRGPLFDGFLAVAPECRACGLSLAGHDSGDGPAVFLIFILGFLVTPAALWVGMTTAWPLWLHAVVWTVVVLGLTLGMLRPAKAAVIALQYRHRRDVSDEPL